MLNSKKILLVGLKEDQIKEIYSMAEGRIPAEFVVLKSGEEVPLGDYCALVLNMDALKQEEKEKITQYLLEVDAASSQKVLIGATVFPKGVEKLPALTCYKNFEAAAPSLSAKMEKGCKIAQRTENAAANIKSVLLIKQALLEGGKSMEELEHITGRKQDAVKRFLELLCLAGEPIGYDYKNRVWKDTKKK